MNSTIHIHSLSTVFEHPLYTLGIVLDAEVTVESKQGVLLELTV